MEAELQSLKPEFSSLQIANTKLEEKVEGLGAAVPRLEAELKSPNAEVDRLRIACDAGEAANTRLKTELEELKGSVVPRLEAEMVELREMMHIALAKVASGGNREAIEDWRSDVSAGSFSNADNAVEFEMMSGGRRVLSRGCACVDKILHVFLWRYSASLNLIWSVDTAL
ncbi:hypothetical protein BDV98DRAFT_566919, partial [Pterulicium gracile]